METKHLTLFDEQFAKINNLKWTPWIGINYSKTGILLLGDSFCDDGEGWPDYDPYAPRSLVLNQGLSSHKPEFASRKFLTVVEKTLLNQEETDFSERENFWTSVAFFNIVQRALPTRAERPQYTDFDIGWSVVLDIAEIIKPKFCIKLGIDGIGRLGAKLASDNPGWKYNADEFYKKPYIINLSKDNYQFKIICINHPTGSFGFDYEHWFNIINEVAPEIRQSLKQQ